MTIAQIVTAILNLLTVIAIIIWSYYQKRINKANLDHIIKLDNRLFKLEDRYDIEHNWESRS